MAVSSSLQSKIIISAQDRGLSTLLRKLSGEADATVSEFSRLGTAVSAAIGGIGAGFAIKKVSDWIEEYKMSAMSIATMFTDTMRGSGKDLNDVFDQNIRHAEAFFRVLQQQSAKSLSSMDDLMQAYTMLANYGRSLSPTMRNAELLANVVDRIRLATKGQNQDIQVLQELRALLNGQSRPSDALARMLRQRDANFSSTLSTMVTGGASAEEILKYINSLFSNVDIGKHLSRSLTKSLELLKGNVKLLAIDAFTPLHDEAARTVAGVAELFDPSSARSPLRRAFDSMSEAVQSVFNGLDSIGNGLSAAWEAAGGSFRDIAKGVASELIPRLATTLATVTLISKGFATIKGLVAAIARTNLTLAGAGAVAYGAYMAVDSFKESTRPISVTDYSPSGKDPDWEWVKGYVTETFNVIKAAFVASASELVKLFTGMVTAIAGTMSEVLGMTVNGIKSIVTGILEATEKTIIFLDNVDKAAPGVVELARHAFDMVVYNFHALGVMMYNGLIDAVNKSVTTVLRLADDLATKIANTFVGMANMLQQVLSNLTFGSYKPRSFPQARNATNFDAFVIDESRKLEYPRRPQRPEVTFPNMLDDNTSQGVGKRMDESRFYISQMLSPVADALKAWGREVNGGVASDAFLSASPGRMAEHFFSLWNESRREWAERYRKENPPAEGKGSAEAVTGNPRTVYDINGSSLKLANSMGNEIERLLRSVIQTGTAMDKASIAMESVSGNSNEYAARLMSMDKELSSLQRSIGSISEGSGLVSKGTEELLDSYRRLREEVASASSEYQRLKSTGEDTESTVGRLNKSLTELHKVIPQLQESLKAELEKGRESAAKQIELLRERQNVERDYLMEMTRLKDEGTFASGLEAGAKSYAHDNRVTDFSEGLRVATETLSSFSSSVSDALYNMMVEGTARLRDVIASFGQSIVRTITDSIARQLTERLASGLASAISTLTGFELTSFSASAALEASSDLLSVAFLGTETAANALTASFSAAAIAIDAAASSIGVSSLLGGAAIPAAKGAVWSGGFTPIMAFARGGVATRPTIGLIGEAGQNEAIVPLPDGRSIPVTLSGSGVGVSVTVNVVNNAGVGVETQRRETDDGTVIDIILDAANRNRRGFRSGMRSALGVGK